MLIKAEQKYLRMSPQKLRLIARALRGIKDPQKVLTYLSFVRKRAALPISKVIKTAIANAKSRGLTPELLIKELQIGEGPTMKRWRAASRGMPHKILKRTSHIRVILETKEVENPKSQIPNPKQIQNSKYE